MKRKLAAYRWECGSNATEERLCFVSNYFNSQCKQLEQVDFRVYFLEILQQLHACKDALYQ